MKKLAAIQAQITRLQGLADDLRRKEIAGVVGRIRVAIDHYGLTAADLGFGPGGSSTKPERVPATRSAPKASGKGVGVAKYRDAASGKTWTGRGKPPNWIAGVADRDAFLITSQGSGAAVNGSSGPGNPARSAAVKSKPVGVARYRDPASGKTWTGRGSPPKWIAGAADRSAFLIAGAS